MTDLLTDNTLERALACEEAAVLLAERGFFGEARPLFKIALETYEGAGADTHLIRALSEMQTYGVSSRVQEPRRRSRMGWDSLTPTERKVVALVPEGFSNREIGRRLFISPRTVQTHLIHAFEKLGVTSRSQLAAELVRRTKQVAD